MVICPECDRSFSVTWINTIEGGPEYCPMCGEPINYVECEHDEN